MISVLWAGKKLNIAVISELHYLMSNFFGPEINNAIEKKF